MKKVFVILTLLLMIWNNSNADEAAPPQQSWAQKYLEAQSTCKKFLKLKKEKAPNNELAFILDIKYKEKCSPNENLLKNLKFPWLKKDILLNGLRTTTNPDVFLNYYTEFLQLNPNDKAKIEYIERTKLFKKILAKTKDKNIKNKLYSEFPVFYYDNKLPIPSEKNFEAAYELRMQRRFADARKIYLNIISENKKKLKAAKPKDTYAKTERLSDISRASDFARATYRVEERKDLGITEYTKIFRFFEDYFLKNPKKDFSHFYTDTGVQLARDMWTEGPVGDAQKLLNSIVEKSNGKAQLDQVYWVLGRMEQEKKNYGGAVEYFQKALNEKPEKDFDLKFRWLIAWNLKKNNQIKESLDKFEEFGAKGRDYQDDFSYFKSLFWQAQLLKKLNQNENAKRMLSDLADKNPLGYYGQLARLETNPDFYAKSFDLEPTPIKTDVISNQSKQTLEMLVQMSEFDIVADYLSHLWHSLEKSNRKNSEVHIAFFEWAHSAQQYKENLQFIEILDDDTKKEILKNYPQLFFPMPYLKTVDRFSGQFEIPREFIFSLMRQESLFDKNARSGADAFGLLQLLPQIAHKYTKTAGVNFSNPEELYNPDVIIPLGAAHIAALIKIFKGSMLLAAASYNAGVDPVKVWVKTRYNGDALEFIEDIPYLETETYTKLIFRNLSYYLQFHPELSKNQKIDILKNYFEM